MASTPEMVDLVDTIIVTDRKVMRSFMKNWGFKRFLPFLKLVVIGFYLDNEERHTRIGGTICHFGREQLPLPPYSPDLASSDVHLFDLIFYIEHSFQLTMM